MPKPPTLRRRTNNILWLSFVFTLVALFLISRSINRSSIVDGNDPSKFASVNEEGEPIIAIVSGTPIYEKLEIANTGITIDPPQGLPNFSLLSHYEKPVSLKDFTGKYILLFFGYTNCPDVCPLTLDGFRRIYNELDEELRKHIAFLLISVDSARDTPERLREYLSAFDVPVTALWGEDEEISDVGEPFGLVRRIIEPGSEMKMKMPNDHENEHQSSENEYLIDHTSSRFLIDAEGRLIRRYLYSPDPATSADRILADLRPLLIYLNQNSALANETKLQ